MRGARQRYAPGSSSSAPVSSGKEDFIRYAAQVGKGPMWDPQLFSGSSRILRLNQLLRALRVLRECETFASVQCLRFQPFFLIAPAHSRLLFMGI
jgi:hypothetical protein